MLSLESLQALARLSPQAREALIDHALVGLPIAEIGRRDGKNRTTVLRLVRSAGRQLGPVALLRMRDESYRVRALSPTPDHAPRRVLDGEERRGLHYLVSQAAKDELADSKIQPCAWCGGPFYPSSPRNIYCAKPCTNAAYAERRRRLNPEWRIHKREKDNARSARRRIPRTPEQEADLHAQREHWNHKLGGSRV